MIKPRRNQPCRDLPVALCALDRFDLACIPIIYGLWMLDRSNFRSAPMATGGFGRFHNQQDRPNDNRADTNGTRDANPNILIIVIGHSLVGYCADATRLAGVCPTQGRFRDSCHLLATDGHEGQWEATPQMGNREMLSLPDRYWVTQIAGAWYLFNPWDVLISGPADATTLHRHAWRDLWRRINQQPNDEIGAIRDGTRSLQELPAVRQSFRLSDTVEEVGAESDTLPNVARPPRWRPSTMVASAMITAFVVTAFGMGPPPDKPILRTVHHEQSLPASAAAQSHPVSVPRKAVVTNVIRSVGITARLVRTSRVYRPPTVAYVVVVGRFESSTAAENLKHLVQSKGYIVHVVLYGALSEVITRPLRTRRQAENVARGLEAAGLQARLMAWGDQ
jgi:hypothetical protein